MTWLYLPPDALTQTTGEEVCSVSPSAPELAASISDSTLPTPDIELWVTLSGKPMQRPRSWRGWKTRPWIAHLSGTTLPASTATLGAARWISFMAAIRASRFPSPDASSETKTHDTFGPTSPASCARSNPAFVSLRTSAGIYDWDSNKSTMTFDQWVTALRRDCLRRKKSVRPTSANGSSSWLTPRAQESAEKQETFLKRNGDRTDRCYGSLTAQTVLWPTATATDATVTRARPPEKMIRKDGRNVLRTPSLAETVMQPRDFPYTKQDLTLAQTERPYRVARAHTRTKWPTPRAQEPGSNAATHGVGLKEIVTRHWATPTARDWKDGVIHNSNAESRSNLSRQAPRTLKDGGVTSNTGLTLNPLFVEALMGWPIGWTDCASAVTGSSRWLRLMRSELSLLLRVSKSEEQLCLI